MVPTKFIERLSTKNANYNDPEQAINQANSLQLLSADIYVDSQRFVYELLQNADDASSHLGSLDIEINFVNNFVIISHSGEAFTEIDIESISSAGDGTKTGDSNKTGFKGIGFKSVFSHSQLVIIKSGDYQFKFDKEHWETHWNNSWGSEQNWKAERRLKNKDDALKMPWQIIPIYTDLPHELKGLPALQTYKVSTIIQLDEVEKLKKVLDDLFSKSQIVLFLRSKKVQIVINTSNKIVLEKAISNDTTLLKRNGNILSQWLIKTEQFEIPYDVQAEINLDAKSPKKLKEATRTEISFAIQLENGKLKPVDKGSRLIFSYLPTSIDYDFPFLVNASFLTDAGRQHLHQDIYWNNWIFKQIPLRFFNWLAQLAHKSSKYNRHFLSIIPSTLGTSQLEQSFNVGFEEAINNIAFVPNLDGDLLKVKESVLDKTNITELLDKQSVIDFINLDKGKDLSVSSLMFKMELNNKLIKLGATVFDLNDLESYFTSEIFSEQHKLEENYTLIVFLYDQYLKQKGEENQSIWNKLLRQIPFIFDSNLRLRSPRQIYFPSIESTHEFTQDISIIHAVTFEKVEESMVILEWLEQLGVKEPTDLAFIEKTIIGQVENFVNLDNAIPLIRYLFNAHKKNLLLDHHYKSLTELKLLTKGNKFIQAGQAYLSNFYEPAFQLENIYQNDFYVAEQYVTDSISKRDLGTFFIKIGVKEDIEVEYQSIDLTDESKWKDRFDVNLIRTVQLTASKYSYVGFEGWNTNNTGYGFWARQFGFYTLPFLNHAFEYNFSKLLFDRVFKTLTPEHLQVNRRFGVSGSTGFYSRYLSEDELEKQNCPSNYFQWLLANCIIFPGTTRKCYKAADTYYNSTENREIGGKYLPVLDYDGILSPEWVETLKLKTQLSLQDYLKILSKIWQDTDLSEVERIENRTRIAMIYEKLAAMDLHESEKVKIKEWSEVNKLLAKNGIDFYYPSDLQIVVEDGFKAYNIAYTQKQTSEMVELLRLFGVNIRDSVNKYIPNSIVEITDLKNKLLQVSPLLAVVAVEKSKSPKEWQQEYDRVISTIHEIHFFETETIFISYGNDDDKQKRSSYVEDNNFYYVGKWYSPRILDGLVGPLTRLLKIGYAERILTVILLETFSDGLEYLREKDLDVSIIPATQSKLDEQELLVPNVGNREYNQSDEDLGKQGELFVYSELKNFYINKYGNAIDETISGFKIGDNVDVVWNNKDVLSSENHDFKISERGKEIYIDSKATAFSKNVEKLALYISGNELRLMESAEHYLIARVFNAASNKPDMEFVTLKRYILE
jgi:hypothetical protein